MKRFLDHVATELYAAHADQLHRLGVILPTHRAERALRLALGRAAGQAIMTPAIWPIEKVMTQLSGLHQASPMEQLLILFEAHQQVAQSQAQSLDDFLHWAPVALRDFGEIDRNGVDAHALYEDMSNIERIAQWGVEEPSTTMAARLAMWGAMPATYDAFHAALQARGLATAGMVFRRAVDSGMGADVLQTWASQHGVDHVVFVGFNALTKPERQLMLAAHEHLGASAFWDVDAHYLNDEVHEAGAALRELRESLPSALTHDLRYPQSHYSTGHADFHIHSAPRTIGVAKTLGTILEDHMATHGHVDDVALVLTDESMLVPVLQALPPNIDEANVTMGLPLDNSPLFSGLEAWFQFQEYRSEASGNIPSRVLESTLVHPVTAGLLGAPSRASACLNAFRRAKRSHWSHSNMAEMAGQDARLWLEDDPMVWLKDFRERLADYVHGLNDAWRQEPGRLCLQAMDRLLEWWPQGGLSYGTMRRLFRQFASEHPVALYGEPFEGLQILGLLESRSMDFETVIVAPANEGQLPSGRGAATYLPNDVRAHHGLPVARDREAVTAYHVYRLLQRASEVHMVYNSETDGMGKGEPSRFITQMAMEVAPMPGVEWHEHVTVWPVRSEMMRKPFEFPRSSEHRERLIRQLQDKGLSPTSLGNFIDRPEDFYHQFIMGVYEEQEASERLASHDLGNVVHDVHAKAYEYWRAHGEWLSEVDRKAATTESLAKWIPGSGKHGPHVLSHAAARQLVETWNAFEVEKLDNPKSRPEGWKVEMVEQNLTRDMVVDGVAVRIKGKADRIETWPQATVVVDLKSGNFSQSDINIDDMPSCLLPRKAKALQLLTYAWLAAGQAWSKDVFQVGIDAVRKPSESVAYLKLAYKNSITRDDLVAFEEQVLKSLVREMLAAVTPQA